MVGTEKHPVAGIIINYDDDGYSQGYGQVEEAFRALAKYDILQPYLSDHDFRCLNARTDDIGYNL